jgi:hypothetical protein
VWLGAQINAFRFMVAGLLLTMYTPSVKEMRGNTLYGYTIYLVNNVVLCVVQIASVYLL